MKGPIVRVNAREIHIKDATYYWEVYTGSSRKINKDPNAVGAFGVPNATIATVDHDLHRARRSYLKKYFSKNSVTTLEPIVQERLTKLCSRVDEKLETGDILSLDGCFSALTADVITRLFYGKNSDYLGVPDFHFDIRDAFLGTSLVYHFARFFPLVIETLKAMPYWVIRLIFPPMADLLELRDEVKENGYTKFHQNKWNADETKSVIVASLNDESVPVAERTVDRLVDEGTILLFAGTETTSRSLAVTMYYLLTHPNILARLRHELETSLLLNKDHIYSPAQLDKLPYLVFTRTHYS